MSKPALGRGLGALLSGAPASARSTSITVEPSSVPSHQETGPDEAVAAVAAVGEPGQQVRRVPLARIQPCPFQPRKEFSEDSLQELADSIREQGILQPLIVRDQGEHLELIAGERRWRAAQRAGLTEVPVLVRSADDREVLELALIENLQRDNLNPLEEALGYSNLIEQFQLRQEDVATKVGKSRALVANSLRLLKLPPDVQIHLRDGRISVGHAKVILGLSSGEEQTLAAESVIRDGLNVRQTETLIEQWAHRPSPIAGASSGSKSAAPRPQDAHIADLENRLRERLGTKVKLQYRKGKGSVQIRFFNDEDLERILEILQVEAD